MGLHVAGRVSDTGPCGRAEKQIPIAAGTPTTSGGKRRRRTASMPCSVTISISSQVPERSFTKNSLGGAQKDLDCGAKGSRLHDFASNVVREPTTSAKAAHHAFADGPQDRHDVPTSS